MKFNILLSILILGLVCYQSNSQFLPQHKETVGSYQNFDWYSNDFQTRILRFVVTGAIDQELMQNNLHPSFEVIDSQIQSVNGLNVKLLISAENQFFQAIVYLQPVAFTVKVTKFEKYQTIKSQDEKYIGKLQYGGYQEFDWNSDDISIIIYRFMATQAINEELEKQDLPQQFTVLRSWYQIVNGINIKLIIEVQDKLYETIVLISPTEDTVKVVKFQSLEL